MTTSVKVLADSIAKDAPRLTTLQIRMPRPLWPEFLTHRVFSRNASSSRAIPVARLIQDAIDDPYIPSHWGKNEPGMQAREEQESLVDIGKFLKLSHPFTVTNVEAWLEMRNQAIAMAMAYSEAGYHKQIVNRLLEPFTHINAVVTATAWDNFLELRTHEDAEPHIRIVANEIEKALSESIPEFLYNDEWQFPYIREEEFGIYDTPKLIKISVARCARVSYMTHDGRIPDPVEDLKLYSRLANAVPAHLSPLEHQATPDILDNTAGLSFWSMPHLHANLVGWRQNRKFVEYASEVE